MFFSCRRIHIRPIHHIEHHYEFVSCSHASARFIDNGRARIYPIVRIYYFFWLISTRFCATLCTVQYRRQPAFYLTASAGPTDSRCAVLMRL